MLLLVEAAYAASLLGAGTTLQVVLLLLGLAVWAFGHLPKDKSRNFIVAGRVAARTAEREGGKVNLSQAEIADVHKATREVLQTMTFDEVMRWVNIGKK